MAISSSERFISENKNKKETLFRPLKANHQRGLIFKIRSNSQLHLVI
jgi:hypothetical protein